MFTKNAWSKIINTFQREIFLSDIPVCDQPVISYSMKTFSRHHLHPIMGNDFHLCQSFRQSDRNLIRLWPTCDVSTKMFHQFKWKKNDFIKLFCF